MGLVVRRSQKDCAAIDVTASQPLTMDPANRTPISVVECDAVAVTDGQHARLRGYPEHPAVEATVIESVDRPLHQQR